MLAVTIVVVSIIALYFIFKAVNGNNKEEISEVVPPVINQKAFSVTVEEAPAEEPKVKKLKAEKKPEKAVEKVKKEPKKTVKKAKQ